MGSLLHWGSSWSNLSSIVRLELSGPHSNTEAWQFSGRDQKCRDKGNCKTLKGSRTMTRRPSVGWIIYDYQTHCRHGWRALSGPLQLLQDAQSRTHNQGLHTRKRLALRQQSSNHWTVLTSLCSSPPHTAVCWSPGSYCGTSCDQHAHTIGHSHAWVEGTSSPSGTVVFLCKTAAYGMKLKMEVRTQHVPPRWASRCATVAVGHQGGRRVFSGSCSLQESNHCS